jgi:putative CocE/NonD family hydrolase
MRGVRMVKCAVFCVWALVFPALAAADDFDFRPPSTVEDAATPAIVRDLATRLIPVYQDTDPDRYLANLSALQMVAGNYSAADVSRQSLRERRRSADLRRPVSRAVIYDMYAYARAIQSEDGLSFADAFTKSFGEVVSRLDDQDAYAVTQWLGAPLPVFREALQKSFDQQRTKDRIGQSEALDLIWKFISFEAYRSFGPLVDALDAEDDRRRYVVDDQVSVRTPDGASITAVVIRPKGVGNPLPTLLEFTIYDAQNYAKECAAHGYVGVVAYTRGRRAKSNTVVPYQHDGDDARAVINWIAKQSWSDGRVGMYGDGYSGFTPWAAAKHLPPALKAIATSASIAPGIGFPMEGSVFQNSAYRWSSHMTNTNATDENNYGDDAQWRSLDQKWYTSGKRYRDMGRLYGKPNPIFIRWLNHPSYDRFWQKMIPYRDEFARIDIPVLTTTGYYAGNEPGDLYYFTQHHRYNPHADHTLLMGPYDDAMMQHGSAATLRGYQVDLTAVMDLRELRYQWFDHVLKGGATPASLQDTVNYEVMGANTWRHAPSLDAMADRSIRFYLEAAATGVRNRLSQRKASKANAKAPKTNAKALKSSAKVVKADETAPTTNAAFVQQSVSFLDRTDATWTPPADLISKSVTAHNGAIFVSEPLPKSTEFDGLFSGRLDFTVNKMDMDLNIVFYELLASGDYVRLFSPTYELRASYVRDRVHRHLLKAGERQELTFKSERITSRRLQAGSRLVMVLGVNKRPDREINYGTGNDVSEESIADGKIPLKIRWHGDSYIDVPVHK